MNQSLLSTIWTVHRIHRIHHEYSYGSYVMNLDFGGWDHHESSISDHPYESYMNPEIVSISVHQPRAKATLRFQTKFPNLQIPQNRRCAAAKKTHLAPWGSQRLKRFSERYFGLYPTYFSDLEALFEHLGQIQRFYLARGDDVITMRAMDPRIHGSYGSYDMNQSW